MSEIKVNCDFQPMTDKERNTGTVRDVIQTPNYINDGLQSQP